MRIILRIIKTRRHCSCIVAGMNELHTINQWLNISIAKPPHPPIHSIFHQPNTQFNREFCGGLFAQLNNNKSTENSDESVRRAVHISMVVARRIARFIACWYHSLLHICISFKRTRSDQDIGEKARTTPSPFKKKQTNYNETGRVDCR